MALRLRNQPNLKIVGILTAALALIAQPFAVLPFAEVFAATEDVKRVVFSPTERTVDAPGVAGALTVYLRGATGTANHGLDTDGVMTLSSSSGTGLFAEGGSSDNWSASPTYVQRASTGSKSLRYKDTAAGTHTLTVTLSGGGLEAPLQDTMSFVVKPGNEQPVPSQEVGVTRYAVVKSPYQGVSAEFWYSGIQDATGCTVTLHREDDTNASRSCTEVTTNLINSKNGARSTISTPFQLTEPLVDKYWTGDSSAWNQSTKPIGMTITIETAHGNVTATSSSPLIEEATTYASIAPVADQNPHTTIVAPIGLVGNKFTVSGLATDDEALNRVYVQLVHRGDSQRYGGKTINLIGKGTEAEWSHEFDAVKLNLPDGQYAAHAQAVDMKGNRYDTGWTTNFTVDRTGPAISNVTPVTGTNVNSDFTVSANVSDPRGVKKVALYVFDQATNTKVKEYPLSSTEGDTWAAQVKLADLRGDAVYDLRFRAADSFYNITYHNNRGGSYLVTVDTTAPTSSNLTITPMINDNIGGTVRVTVELTDVSGVDTNSKYTYIRFFANGNEYTYAFTKVESTENTYEAIVNTRDFVRVNTSDVVRASLRFADNAGNGRSSKPDVLQNIRVDNSGPGSSLVSPESGKAVRGNLTLKLGFTDHTGVKSARVKLSNDQVERWYDVPTITDTNGEITIDTTTLPDGEYTVGIRPVDSFGAARMGANKGIIIVDNIAPAQPEDDAENSVSDNSQDSSGSDSRATGAGEDNQGTAIQTLGASTTNDSEPVSVQSVLGRATGGSGILNPAVIGLGADSGSSEEEEGSTTRVLGDEDVVAQTDGEETAAGNTTDDEVDKGCYKFLGLCWYWWVLIVVALVTVAVLVRKAVSTNEADDVPGRRL